MVPAVHSGKTVYLFVFAAYIESGRAMGDVVSFHWKAAVWLPRASSYVCASLIIFPFAWYPPNARARWHFAARAPPHPCRPSLRSHCTALLFMMICRQFLGLRPHSLYYMNAHLILDACDVANLILQCICQAAQPARVERGRRGDPAQNRELQYDLATNRVRDIEKRLHI